MFDLVPSVFVGTYAKYNYHNSGDWIEPAQYSSRDEFLKACAELHSDEKQPEFMFQDWENIPKGLISECSISPDLWVFLDKTKEWDEDQAKAFNEFVEAGYAGGQILIDLENFESAYQGKFESEEDFAHRHAWEEGIIDRMEAAKINTCYFDYVAYARDLFINSFYYGKSYVFTR